MKTSVVVVKLGLLFLILKVYAVESTVVKQDLDWWKTSVIYQIYPRSFKDSDGDGIGDLNGITSKLEHIKDIGAEALWLSPIYASPQKDFGYDISNFTDISPDYGSLKDFDNLIAKAKSLDLKVLLDFVPNHSSDEHDWFKKSIDRIKPYDEYYIWRDGKDGGPPNNWLSAFGGSAWEYNEKREQYYYHAFDAGQPDLNYRDAKLAQEMKTVLSFWMKRGVDGFRVDAINHLFEDPHLTDEPKSGLSVPLSDYDYLNHIYTKDLNDTYGVVRSWQTLLDKYVKIYNTDGKFLILEAYTNISNSMKFYEVGSLPFNFVFIASLNNNSIATDFKKSIDVWINSIPKNQVTNWVVGNHDNHRVASRYGFNNNRADQITMLACLLPGMTVVYNGDEIGMVDRPFTFEETVDPAGVYAGPQRYQLKSRDPERTPFQWDNSTSAGFSTNNNTWLPVHENYKILNLAAQKIAPTSHYKVFKALTKLKKTSSKGKLQILLASEKVLAVLRRLSRQQVIVLLINFDNEDVTINAKAWLNIPRNLKIHIASVKSGLTSGEIVDTSKLTLPGATSIILN